MEDNIIHIEEFIGHEKEGTYFTVPFNVPENVSRIVVSYDYYRPTKGFWSDLHPTNCIDIGLADENGGFLGWSGSSHPEISVGEFSSSDGYLNVKPSPGEWKILVGAYHVEEKGVTVNYTIRFEYDGMKLFLGDLHIHTRASDGVLDASEAANLAKKNGLDFIALANHNNYAENLHLPAVNGITFIPATEWTHYNGHMNFFGVNNPFGSSFIANNAEEMHDVISNAKSRGAVISVNHPKCRFCPYKWGDDEAFEMVEIWNGPMRPTNVRGIAYWTDLLKKGKKLPAVGGSDFHKQSKVSDIGKPVTAVYSPSQGAGDLLNSIKSGHCFVSESPDGPVILLKYGNAIMGDTAEYSENVMLDIDVKCSYPVKKILVTDKGEQELYINSLRPEKVKFAYVKVVKKLSGKICAISNPIYFY